MNNIKQSMDVIDLVTKLADETPEQTEARRKENAERRETEALIAKLENNDIYANKDRGFDEETGSFKASRKNDAWDMRDSDYL